MLECYILCLAKNDTYRATLQIMPAQYAMAALGTISKDKRQMDCGNKQYVVAENEIRVKQGV